MEKTGITWVWIFFLLAMGIPVSKGQGTRIPVTSEKVFLTTDRNLYVVGEQVHFEAKIRDILPAQEARSLVLYVEVITADGKKVVGNKIEVKANTAVGCLALPVETNSGIYFLRAYTRTMRQGGPEGYAYLPIKIVNPLKEGISDPGESSAPLPAHPPSQEGNDPIRINTGRVEYHPGESVSVNIEKTGSFLADPEEWQVSVVPESTFSAYAVVLSEMNPKSALPHLGTETRGLTISGEVKEMTTGRLLADARVNLTLIGAGRDFMPVQTDSTGRFFFSLPAYMGYRELFLSAEHKSKASCQVLVDNDFCTLPVHFIAPKFSLSQEERDATLAMARNLQIRKYFENDSLRCPDRQETEEVAFYGTPSAVLKLDEFIQLPTLEEYFNELPTPVKVRKKSGGKYFKVTGSQTEMNYFEPLVLVDWVAVPQTDKILAASPSTIDRIEVITVPYVKGEITYGGIISIISKKGNFGGIDLPSSGIFLNYQFLSDSCPCEIPIAPVESKPDTRNTLYWNPNLQFNGDAPVSFSFQTPDTPGAYQIVVQGLNANGERIRSTQSFVVKGQ